jgi:hypothetical protein
MTKTTKRTVFISSTYEDLIPQRKRIWELLADYDVNIRGMERFGARKETPLETCLAEVEQSDIYIGIISFRLGSIEKTIGKSYTQLEYEKALDLKREIFIYLVDEKNSKLSPQFIDFGEKYEKLQSFKSILKDRHTIDTFVDENDLYDKLKRKFDDLLIIKTKKEKIIDEYVKSKINIDRFLLVPKAFSGKEIKLKVNFKSEPFPASKDICSAFSLDYGKTIGVEINILAPEIKDSPLKYLYIDYNKLDTFWAIQESKEIELYAQLQFSDEPITNEKANFIEKTYLDSSTMILSGSTGYGMGFKTIKAEGHILLRLIDILKNE